MCTRQSENDDRYPRCYSTIIYAYKDLLLTYTNIFTANEGRRQRDILHTLQHSEREKESLVDTPNDCGDHIEWHCPACIWRFHLRLMKCILGNAICSVDLVVSISGFHSKAYTLRERDTIQPLAFYILYGPVAALCSSSKYVEPNLWSRVCCVAIWSLVLTMLTVG